MGEINILEKLREQIDNMDNEILILLKRRFQTVKKVAEYKLRNNLETLQIERENQLIRDKSTKAITMNISDSFVREIFELILKESKNEQNKFLEKEAKKQK